MALSFDDLISRLNLPVTEEQAKACRFLESRGHMFCGDFGTENAIQKANMILALEQMESYVKFPRPKCRKRQRVLC